MASKATYTAGQMLIRGSYQNTSHAQSDNVTKKADLGRACLPLAAQPNVMQQHKNSKASVRCRQTCNQLNTLGCV